MKDRFRRRTVVDHALILIAASVQFLLLLNLRRERNLYRLRPAHSKPEPSNATRNANQDEAAHVSGFATKEHIVRTGNTAREMWKLLEPAKENAMFAYGSQG
jgi:hypothetical protein